MFRTLFLVFTCFLIVSCGPAELHPDPNAPPPPPPPISAVTYRYEVFQVVDSVGITHGSGYDIYSGDKKLIHQTTIPGEQGTDGFINDEEAGKVAQLVIDKLSKADGFPTITHDELVNLGITLQSK